MPLLSPLADWVRSRPALRKAAHLAVRLIPDVPYTVKVAQIGPLRIRMRRHRWFLWEKFGQGDTFMLGVFNRLVRPGDVAYDIGANIGVYTRVMKTWFGASKIIAFEPMQENFELLAANIELGGMGDSIKAYRLALSDVEGQEQLQIDDMTSGTAVLDSIAGGQASDGRRAFGLAPKTETVTVVRLDEFVRENAPPPGMMKIDTEGAEARVLEGGRQTLLRHKPRLAIALHGEDKALATLRLLDELGYVACGFVNDPEAKVGGHVWRQLHAADAAILANNNIVASMDAGDVMTEIVPQAGGRQ